MCACGTHSQGLTRNEIDGNNPPLFIVRWNRVSACRSSARGGGGCGPSGPRGILDCSDMGTVCSRQNRSGNAGGGGPNDAGTTAARSGTERGTAASAIRTHDGGAVAGREASGTIGAISRELHMLLGGADVHAAAASVDGASAMHLGAHKTNMFCACDNYFCVHNFDPRLVSSMFTAQRARIRKQKDLEREQLQQCQHRFGVGAGANTREEDSGKDEDKEEEEELREFQHRPKTLIQLCVESIADNIALGKIDNIRMLPQVRFGATR